MLIALHGMGATAAASAAESAPQLPAASRCERELSCRAVFAVALRCYQEGEYETALEGFQSGFESSEDPLLLVYLGRSLSKLGRYQAALDHYRKYQHAVSSPGALPQEEVQQDIAELQAKLFPESFGLDLSKLNAKRRRKGNPLYGRGWFWGVAGVGTAALVLGLSLGLGLPALPASHQTVMWNY